MGTAARLIRAKTFRKRGVFLTTSWAIVLLAVMGGFTNCTQYTQLGISSQDSFSPVASASVSASELAANPCQSLGADPTLGTLPPWTDDNPLPAIWGAEGTELAFGNFGDGHGQWTAGQGEGRFSTQIKNFAFDKDGYLYVLDGGKVVNGITTGNFRVQIFDNDGNFFYQFSVWDAALIGDDKVDRNNPGRIAVDSTGKIYITQPDSNLVIQYTHWGDVLHRIQVPSNSYAITVRSVGGVEEVDVAGTNWELVNWSSWGPVGGKALTVINPKDGSVATPVSLSVQLFNIVDMQADHAGNLYFIADPLQSASPDLSRPKFQIFKFDQRGQLQFVFGSGIQDGYAFQTSISIDDEGFIYTIGAADGAIIKIDPTFKYMIRRQGQFGFGDPWGGGSPLVVNHKQLWLGVHPYFGYEDYSTWPIVDATHVKSPNGNTYHIRPNMIRLLPDFLSLKTKLAPYGISLTSTVQMGINPGLWTSLPNNLSNDPTGNISLNFGIGPANRVLKNANLIYQIQDVNGAVINQGSSNLDLSDAQAVQQSMSFQPSGFGWYMASAYTCNQGQLLNVARQYIGVTPTYPELTNATAADISVPSAAKWVYSGLPAIRLSPQYDKSEQPTEQNPNPVHPLINLDDFEHQVDDAIAQKASPFIQITDDIYALTEANVTALVNRLGSKVQYWEVYNEPNLSVSPKWLVEKSHMVHDIVSKASGLVLGPSVCGIDLGWIQAFYNEGGRNYFDIMAVHDYEGHGSIDPVHWRWKYQALKDLMATNEDPAKPIKPIWQTEVGSDLNRGSYNTLIQQAMRMNLHYDLLESMGIPAEHNFYYYLQDNGFIDFFIWGGAGPQPGVLTMRTRQAMIKNKTYQGMINFGASGDNFYLGLRYQAKDGSSVVNLSTLGSASATVPATLTDSGSDRTSSLTVFDSFGNRSQIPVQNKHVNFAIQELPTYVQLAAGQSLSFDQTDFGKNIADQATFSYSSDTNWVDVEGNARSHNVSFLNDGTMATFQAGGPSGDTNAPYLFFGWMDNVTPQTLDMKFSSPKKVSQVVLYSMEPDNVFSALLDFDLQANVNGSWVTLKEYRTNLQHTNPGIGWMTNANQFILQGFSPVTTKELRVIFYRATKTCVPPETWTQVWGNNVFPSVNLKEVEIY